MFGKFLKSLGGQGGPSPFSQMDNAQRLQALGYAFSGQDGDFADLLSSVREGGGRRNSPIMNAEGEDISAAFAPQMGAYGLMGQEPGMMLGVPGLLAGRRFFGRKK